MRRLKIDYTVYNFNGGVQKSGHINYSLSHFIYALFQKNYIKNISAHSFWSSLNNVLTNASMGLVYYAFMQNNPSILTKALKKGIFNLMHSFGYFVFHDICGTYPIFVKLSSRVYVVDIFRNQAMSFHFSLPSKKISNPFNSLYMTTFVVGQNMSLLHAKDTFKLKIVDPVSSGQTDNSYIKEYNMKKDEVLLDLIDSKEFIVKFNSLSLKITISLDPLKQARDEGNLFSDGEILIVIEEQLKISDYNCFIDDECLVVALRTASIVRLDEDKYSAFKQGFFQAMDDEQIFKLKKLGFLVSDVDEYKQLQIERKKAYERNRNSFGLTILPTTMCNARCPYCYEEGIEKVTMPKSVQNKIVALIESHKKEKIHLSWFGGEPLVNAEAIDFISQQLKVKNIDFTASMVSNGYLLDCFKSNFKLWNLKAVQITLDGVEDEYNIIKNYIYNNNNAFRRVIENIELLLANDIKLTIRLNFNKYNYKGILDCIDYIHEKFGNHKLLNVYVNHIFGEQSTYHLADGTNLYLVMFKKLMDCGYVKSLFDLNIKPKQFYCFTTNPRHRVVNANGDLYICEHAVVNEQIGCVGTIEVPITNSSNFTYWTSLDYPYPKCRHCKFLYICQGGCKSESLRELENISCLPFIDSFEEIIKYYYYKKRGGGQSGNH